MKSRLLTSIFVLLAIISFAQNEDDALRYSRLAPVGTARFTSMGGAFGSLGGELGCAAYNPAGIGVFRSSQMTFSGAWSTMRNQAEYYGQSNTTTKSVFNLSNLGFVIANPISDESGWKYLNFSMVYNQLANLNKNVYISGSNNQSSLLDGQLQDALDFGTDNNLFYDADLLFVPSGQSQLTNDYIYLNKGYGSNQSKSIQSKGFVGEYDFNISGNFNDRFFVGGTIGLVRAKYQETSVYDETPTVEGIDLLNFNVTDYFQTVGTGFNFKAGMIFKANDFLRLGAAIQTPTIYNMHDNYDSKVHSKINYFNNQTNSYEIGNNEAKSDRSFYDWELTTPLKAMASIGFIFQKHGSLSIDYEILDYSQLNLNADDDPFTDVNNTISNIYTTGSNIRIGGEFLLGPVSFRGGFGYYSSPYVSSQANSDANYIIYSGGIGFRAKEAYIDFGYSHSQMDEKYFLYGAADSKSGITNSRNTFITTVGFRF